MARPTKCTPAITAMMAQLVANGVSGAQAARLCNLDPHTHYDWMKRDEEPFATYSASIKRAEAELERKALEGIMEAGQKNWTAWAWILERKWPERYGKQDRQMLDLDEVRRMTEEEARAAGLSDAETKRAVELAERIARGED